jgi:hypothetical protein
LAVEGIAMPLAVAQGALFGAAANAMTDEARRAVPRLFGSGALS